MCLYSGEYQSDDTNFIDHCIDKYDKPTLCFVESLPNIHKKLKLLIDCGSTLSLIREDQLHLFGNPQKNPDNVSFTAADGKIVTTLGVCNICLKFSTTDATLDVQFHVVQGLPVPALLGNDILHKMILDFQNKRLIDKERQMVLNLYVEPPGIHMCDFVDILGNYAWLDTKSVEYAKHLENPHILDNVSKRFIPVRRDGTVKIPEEVIDSEIDFRLEGPIVDLKPNLSLATFEHLEEKNAVKPVKSILDIDINPNLNPKLREKYVSLLTEYQELFIYDLKDIGLYNGPEEFSVRLTTDRPQNGKTYPIPSHMKEAFSNHISELLANDLIEPCEDTSYSHGFLAVPKKDGSVRWASDMRLLNAITEEDSYNLPLIPPLLREMSGNRVFSSLDIFACFHQFRVRESDRNFFAFEDPLTGLRYRWKRCYFGLKNIPQFVSYLMANRVFRHKNRNECSVYIDDVNCFNQNHVEMLDNLRDVFERVRFFGLKFKSTKCHFGYDYCKAFGFVVNEEGVTIDPERVKKLSLIQRPKSKKQLHTALGGIGYYRDCLPNLAKYTSVLNPMLADSYQFDWNTEQDEAWQEMIKDIGKAIMINKPKFGQRMIVTTDASLKYYGGTLSQEYDEQKFLLAVHSAQFTKNVLNWSINVKELLSAVMICEKFEYDLLGHKFLLRTDSTWVYYLIKNANNIFYRKSGPVVRLLMRMSRFEFEIEHFRGTKAEMQLADLMSRLNCDKVLLHHRTVGDLLTPIKSDGEDFSLLVVPQIFSRQQIRDFVKESQKIHADEIIKRYGKRPGFNEETLELRNKLLVPDNAVPRLLKMVHQHHGINREISGLKSCDVKWDTMMMDVLDYAKSCTFCSRLRKVNTDKAVSVEPRLPRRAFESVAIDILQAGQKSEEAIYILGLVCHLTGFLLLAQVKSLELKHSLNQILQWVLQYNITEACIRADNAFNKNEFIEMMNLVNCYPRFGCPANSTSNAEIERRFRNVNEVFRVYQLADNGVENIPLSLSFVMAHLNAKPLSGVAICPYEAVYGMTPKMYLMEPLPDHVVNNLQEFAGKQYRRMLELSRLIEHHYDKLNENKETTKNKDLLKVGDKVRILKPPSKGMNKWKYLPYSEDVFEIRQVREPTKSYVIELRKENRQPLQILVHHRRVKKVFDRPARLCETNKGGLEENVINQIEANQKSKTQKAGQGNNIPTTDSVESDHSGNNTNSTESNTEPDPVRTRTGRLVNKPSRFR